MPRDWTARVGEYDFSVNSSTEVNYRVEKLILHPKYSNITQRNDIGLVKLSNKIRLNEHHNTICLPSRSMQIEQRSAYVIGTSSIRFRLTTNHCQCVGRFRHPVLRMRFKQSASRTLAANLE